MASGHGRPVLVSGRDVASSACSSPGSSAFVDASTLPQFVGSEQIRQFHCPVLSNTSKYLSFLTPWHALCDWLGRSGGDNHEQIASLATRRLGAGWVHPGRDPRCLRHHLGRPHGGCRRVRDWRGRCRGRPPAEHRGVPGRAADRAGQGTGHAADRPRAARHRRRACRPPRHTARSRTRRPATGGPRDHSGPRRCLQRKTGGRGRLLPPRDGPRRAHDRALGVPVDLPGVADESRDGS